MQFYMFQQTKKKYSKNHRPYAEDTDSAQGLFSAVQCSKEYLSVEWYWFVQKIAVMERFC